MTCTANACDPTPFATGQVSSLLPMATDGTYLYGGGTTDLDIKKCAVGGCNNTPTVLVTDQFALAMAVDSVSVYWTNNSSPVTIMRLAK